MTISELTYKAISQHDWEGMEQYLSRMNTQDFRRVQTEIRESVLPSMENDDMWETYLHLIRFRKPAFLACITGAGNLARKGKISFDNEHVNKISVYLREKHPEAMGSLINLLLPILTDERQIGDMFRAFGLDVRTCVASLLRQDTPLTYYVLFRTLRQMQDDKRLLAKCCVFIQKKKDDVSLNMACIIKEYFGLTDVVCPKSLSILPYELSYIDRSYESFNNVLLGKRPKV